MGAGLDARASRGAFAAVNAGGRAEPDARSAIRLRRRSSAHEISPSAPSHASSSFVVSVEPLRSSCVSGRTGQLTGLRSGQERADGTTAQSKKTNSQTVGVLKDRRAGYLQSEPPPPTPQISKLSWSISALGFLRLFSPLDTPLEITFNFEFWGSGKATIVKILRT